MPADWCDLIRLSCTIHLGPSDTQAEAARQRKKEEERAKQETKRREKLLKGKVPPAELFKSGEYAGKFSQYDEQVRGPQFRYKPGSPGRT